MVALIMLVTRQILYRGQQGSQFLAKEGTDSHLGLDLGFNLLRIGFAPNLRIIRGTQEEQDSLYCHNKG